MVRIIVATLFLCLVAIATPAAADNLANYPFSLAKTDPKGLAAWQRILPPKFKRIDWVYRLDGTADEMKRVEIGGKPYRLGWVCKPHDCGNQLAFLIALDRSRAVGVVQSEQTGNLPLWLGSPTAEEIQTLRDKLSG